MNFIDMSVECCGGSPLLDLSSDESVIEQQEEDSTITNYEHLICEATTTNMDTIMDVMDLLTNDDVIDFTSLAELLDDSNDPFAGFAHIDSHASLYA